MVDFRFVALAFVAAALLPATAAATPEGGWFDEEQEPEEATQAGEPEEQAPPARTEGSVVLTPSPEPERPRCKSRWNRSARPKGSRSLALFAGKARLDAPELASALERAGFDDPSRLGFVGIQGTRVFPRRLVLGLGATIAKSSKLEREDGAAGRLMLLQLRGNLGFALAHTEHWLVYPALEIAGSRLEIDLGAAGSESFDGALAEPRTGTELVRTSVAAGPVIAIEKRFPIRWNRRGDDRARFFSLGLRAGYQRELVASPWRVDGDSGAAGPEERLAIKYVGLIVGFGSASL
jgi:hypothetical protein